MKFVKMQANGNDYVYVAKSQITTNDLSSLAKKVSNRRFGVGSDGLIVIDKIDSKTISMQMFNSDGSEGKTCGNGVRCSAFFAQKYLGVTQSEITVLTKSNPSKVQILSRDSFSATVKANMGVPKRKFTPFLVQSLQKVGLYVDYQDIFEVDVGNPHLVFFTDKYDLFSLSNGARKSNFYKDGINVERVYEIENLSPKHYRILCEVYERGSGKTLSCGSGGVAVAYSFAQKHSLDVDGVTFTVSMDGGDAQISFENDCAFLQSEVKIVFEGELKNEV